jgi:hypothetical protein
VTEPAARQEPTFAHDFKPRFPASKVGEFCGRKSERVTVKFLRQFEPFSKIVTRSSAAKSGEAYVPKGAKPLLKDHEKRLLKQTLDSSICTQNLTFNDKHVMNSFGQQTEKKELVIVSTTAEGTTVEGVAVVEGKTEAEAEEQVLSIEEELEKQMQVARYISCMRGRILEDHVVARVNEETEYMFEKNKTRTIVDFGLFKVVGIIDGISKDGNTILEIKTRNKLNTEKNTITGKERKQALTYLKMYDCDSCLFVEADPDGNLKKTEIDWDESEFNNEILAKLNEFVMYARSLTEKEFCDLLEKYQLS